MKLSPTVLVGLASSSPIAINSELDEYLNNCSFLACSDGFSCWNGEACISDSECLNMEGEKNVIFNHFSEYAGELRLIAECRSYVADPTPGFTCGNDPSLKTGTEVYIPKRIVQRRKDERKTTILPPEQHLMLQALLGEHVNCPVSGTEVCNPITIFNESSCEGVEVNDLVHFPNAFNYGEGCMPVDVDNGTDGLSETKTIYVGYDDLVSDTPFGPIFRAMGKTYEISCTIDKTGNVSDGVKTETERDDDEAEGKTGTTFEMKTTFAGRPYDSEQTTIQIRPDLPESSRFEFSITSNAPHEYVHIEECKLSLVGTDREVTFIDSGCVSNMDIFFEMNDSTDIGKYWKLKPDELDSPRDGDEWSRYIYMKSISGQRIGNHADSFFMKPLTFGCTSEWKIDCTVTSCSADLELTNPEIYQKYCSAGDMCPTRYTNILAYLRNASDGESGVHSGRSRRSTDDATSPDEAHVDTTMVHPCFHVNIHSPQYCIDLNDPASCWTIDLCADQFDDFNPNSINAAPQHPEPPVINEDPYELRQFMDEIHDQIKMKIDEVIATQHPSYADQLREAVQKIQIQRSENAKITKTVDDAVNQLIDLISASS